MVWGSQFQIGENLPQGKARHRPIVGVLIQHQPCVTHRPQHDYINKGVHGGACCLPISVNWNRRGKRGAVDVMGQASRFGAGYVVALQRWWLVRALCATWEVPLQDSADY